jgi:hypothetical protein
VNHRDPLRRGCCAVPAYLLLAWLLGTPGMAMAQPATPSVLAVDTVAALDHSVIENGKPVTGLTFDAVASVAMGRNFEAIVRPLATRLASGEWNRQVWVAAVRFQHSGTVGVRVDAGLIPSPIGLGNLMLRPHLNPTIFQLSSLFTALPAVAPGAPRATLLGPLYPVGAHATVSGLHWDARAAVLDTSPVRTRRIFADNFANPPRIPAVVVGGGVTPFVGIRVGGSVTRTGWQRAGESPLITTDRGATVYTVESEVSFRYTRLMGEWTRNVLETGAGNVAATGWFLQGQQTLTPRWFVAARGERMAAPVFAPAGLTHLELTSVEETIGYRITRELTLRAGHRARRLFGRPSYDHQGALSVVWWRRWM